MEFILKTLLAIVFLCLFKYNIDISYLYYNWNYFDIALIFLSISSYLIWKIIEDIIKFTWTLFSPVIITKTKIIYKDLKSKNKKKLW